MPPRLSTPSFRPLSAIFIGDLPDNLTQSPRQLPSPPSTNSQGSGDSGSSRSKSRTALMDEPRSRPQSRISIQEYPKPRNTSSSEEEDNDGDHTARLLSDSRVNSSISSSSVASLSRASSRAHTRFDENPPSGRASSIAARNRQVLDRMSTALSSSRLNTPTSRTTQRSPIPPRPPHLETSSSRQINTRQHELEGSETEREKAAYSSDELSTPPSSSLVPTFEERNSQVDLDSRSASRSQGRTYITGLNGTSTRRRPPAFGDISGESGQHSIFTDAVAAAVQSTPAPTRKSPHRIRNPLPREFRGESQEGDSHAREPSFTSETSHSSQYTSTRQLHSYESSSQHRSPSRNYSRPVSRISSAVNTGRRSPDHSAMETDTYGKSRPAFRSQTLRERRPPLDEHFGPESTQPPEDRRNQDRPPTTKPWRYQNRGGSAESALAGHTRVRSLVGAELRAAGLTQDISWSPTKRREERREREYPDANSSKHDGPSGNSSSSAISEGSNDPRALEMRRDRLSRGGLGVKGNDNIGDRGNDLRYDPKTPVATNSRYSISAMSRANDYSAPISRPSTSAQVYESQPPRTAPPQLRNYRSSYSIPERVAELQASQSTVTGGHSSPIGAIRDRDRNLPTPLGEGSSPMSEHAKLMQDALRSFESNLGRLPKSSANNVQDCISSAHTIVRAAEILNGLLRSSANRALEELIEAEVGDEVQSEEVSDIWKRVGLELRDGLKVSDEIVRTMTALLLDIGKVVRDATSLSGGSGYASPAPTGSASNYSGGVRPVGRDRDNLHLRAVSLDGEALARSGRGSAGGSGGGSVVSRGSEERRSSRRSIEGPSPLPSSSGRRSIEGYSGGRRSVEGRRSIEGYSNGRRSVEGYAEVEGRGTSNVSRDYISPNRTGKEMYSDHEASFEEGPSSRRVSSRLSNAYDMQRATPNLERSRPLTSLDGSAEMERRQSSESTHSRSGPAPLREKGILPSSTTRRLLSIRNRQVSPLITTPSLSHNNSIDFDSPLDTSSPTPSGRASGLGDRARRFPPLAVPPPLSTLPSEATITVGRKTVTQNTARQRPSSSGTGLASKQNSAAPTFSRRKTSTGAFNIRGNGSGNVAPGGRFPIQTSPSKPTTQLTTTTVSTATEYDLPDDAEEFDMSRTHGRSGTVDLGGRGQRRRTLSTASIDEVDPVARREVGYSAAQERPTGLDPRRFRTAQRSSLDGNARDRRAAAELFR